LTRVFDTWAERTTLVPYSSIGGGSAAEARSRKKRNGPALSPALAAAARRFIRIEEKILRNTHAVGAATAPGSLPSLSDTASGWNVSPLPPGDEAVWAVMSL